MERHVFWRRMAL